MPFRSRILSVAAATIALGFVAAACGDSAPESDSSDHSGQYTAGDLSLDARPEHIVSLSATATEMLYAIDAGDQVTAVDITSNYPESVPATDLDAFTPNVEAIAGYEPDLVVVSHDQDDIIAKLGEVKLPVYFAPAAVTLDDTYQQINDLGALTGHPDEAETLSSQMDADINDATGRLPDEGEPLTAYYELDAGLFSLTSDTFAGSLLERAGLSNIADEADDAAETGGYPQLSAEFVVDADPDVIFVSTGGEDAAAELAKRDGWDTITAVKN
ncbi:MAG: ABC transporter substrate-binding protein, partial [Stackebrandtia sp.]